MGLFLIIFLSIYGSWHYYGWRKTRAVSAAQVGRPLRWAVFLFSLFMMVSPILVRVLERVGEESSARLLALVSYTWMGLLFVSVCLFFCVDCVRALVRLVALVRGRQTPPFPVRPVYFFVLILSVLGMGYGFYEARSLRVEHLVLQSPKISEANGPIRIVQISDLHLGLMVGKKRLAAILDAVRKESPDLLVATGDLVDGQANGLAGLAEMFEDINPRLGKYAVTGNHEYYVGLGHSLAFIEKAGFTMLRNRTENIGEDVMLAGVDDKTGERFTGATSVDIDDLIRAAKETNKDRYTVLLKHQPVVDLNGDHLADLQLSGHTHQGQLFPFVFATRLRYSFASGLTLLPGGGALYVNRGAGTWGPPVRIFAPPEITVIDLAPEGK